MGSCRKLGEAVEDRDQSFRPAFGNLVQGKAKSRAFLPRSSFEPTFSQKNRTLLPQSKFGNNRRTGKLPTLVDLCVQSAIDNINSISDVGETDTDLLQRILPHCNSEQLMRIETSTSDRDLSSITNELWHKLYVRNFGMESENLVVERMRKRNISFKWRMLFKAKQKEREELKQKSADRLKQLYVEAESKKQSRQIQLTNKVPPVNKRIKLHRGGAGSSAATSHLKGNLMKKSMLEYLSSNEAAMRKQAESSNRTGLLSRKFRK